MENKNEENRDDTVLFTDDEGNLYSWPVLYENGVAVDYTINSSLPFSIEQYRGQYKGKLARETRNAKNALTDEERIMMNQLLSEANNVEAWSDEQ